MRKMKQLLECVPNFSEGRDMDIIRQIVSAITSVEGVTLLNVDPGASANRTVVTFAGEADPVEEAAYRMATAAASLIDMSRHHGTHPRIGATDVLPLVPISGITLEEAAARARRLAERMVREGHIPSYCYEAAALRPQFANLAVCRAGEYEGIASRWTDSELGPDFRLTESEGGLERTLKTGVSVVGARNYLIAVNFNLNTKSTETASEIACDVRERGRMVVTEGGERRRQPGSLKGVKAIGWYIEEYGMAQVSMNITDMGLTPLHRAYEEVSRCATLRGVRVTGTEIIGLVPQVALTDAGCHFLGEEAKGKSREKLMECAIESMNLSQLRPFRVSEKVIEAVMAKGGIGGLS